MMPNFCNKKSIKKIALAAAMVLTVAINGLALTACHGSKEARGFEIPESFDENKKIEITFWAKNDTNKTQTRIYEKAIKNFEELYPNVDVTIRLYTDYGKIYNDVITNIATDTTPNVCITYPDHIATYMTGADTVEPLDDLFADEKYGLGGSELKYDAPTIDEIVPEFLSECKIGGSHYAIPYMRSTEACYVNKDFVEQLGFEMPEVLTWDFVWEVSEAALAKNEDGTYKLNGQKVMIPFIYKSTDNMMIQMLKQQGAGYSNDKGDIELFSDDTKASLMTIAEHAKTGAFSTFKISGYPANFLNAGQCIFAVDSTAGSTWMGSKAPLRDIAEDKVVDFETVVYPIPQYYSKDGELLDDSIKAAGGRYAMISQGPSICIFNKEDPQVVLASWLFAQYMLTNDVQMAYAETEGYVPVTTKAQESAEYKDYLNRAGEDNSTYYDVKIAATKLLLDNQRYTFVTSVFNGSTSLRDAAGALIENVTKSVRRKKEVDDDFIVKLYDDTRSLYHLDSGSAVNAGKADLGELPEESKWLIRILIGAWVLIGAYFFYSRKSGKISKE
ncbi:ABC transporter substrate-binding protein [Butyrivibrio sp. INlla16]|uniref:ABC transporter substrate-binding protein n=1 Tax=Butyrivibrio sp. INlla16 TaxID=1520807 RepID=UPI0008880E0C|nr:extracellular solute-binding protein [Butyrivibrio sp. INlla16]SDB19059.1 multiple sugar transport system substrate-binding protein [Butyrivibrio sp. INlla16]